MSAIEEAVCTCNDVIEGIRLTTCHHRYFDGKKRLESVSSVLRSTWPIPPDFSKADPAVIENARERGVVTDSLFSAYVVGKLDRIPAGTRKDSVDLFMKAKRWWDQGPHANVESQKILHDEEIAGTCDVTFDGFIFDVKCTHNLEATYPLQVAGYADLHEKMTGLECQGIGILHLSERFPEARWVPLNLEDCRRDWRTLRSMWSMVQRLK
jgi:hypothetical protein